MGAVSLPLVFQVDAQAVPSGLPRTCDPSLLVGLRVKPKESAWRQVGSQAGNVFGSSLQIARKDRYRN